MANPYWHFGLLSLGATVVMTFALSFLIHPLLAWLVTISLITLVTFRYDKAIAGSGRMRVPEKVLLLLEAIGGTIGAVIGMWFIRPRHKTQSGNFLFWFFLILILQVVAIIAHFYFAVI